MVSWAVCYCYIFLLRPSSPLLYRRNCFFIGTRTRKRPNCSDLLMRLFPFFFFFFCCMLLMVLLCWYYNFLSHPAPPKSDAHTKFAFKPESDQQHAETDWQALQGLPFFPSYICPHLHLHSEIFTRIDFVPFDSSESPAQRTKKDAANQQRRKFQQFNFRIIWNSISKRRRRRKFRYFACVYLPSQSYPILPLIGFIIPPLVLRWPGNGCWNYITRVVKIWRSKWEEGGGMLWECR